MSRKGLIAAVEHKARPKADPSHSGDIGAPMSGVVVELRAQVGASIQMGDPICVLSAMKMETVVSSPVSGTIKEILVAESDSLMTGDLICRISK
jgi:pyruvate carboxylase